MLPKKIRTAAIIKYLPKVELICNPATTPIQKMTNANGASATWMKIFTIPLYSHQMPCRASMACAYNRHRLTEPAIHTTLPTIITTLAISREKPRTELP